MQEQIEQLKAENLRLVTTLNNMERELRYAHEIIGQFYQQMVMQGVVRR